MYEINSNICLHTIRTHNNLHIEMQLFEKFKQLCEIYLGLAQPDNATLEVNTTD